jgi:hypothetical protein
MWAGSQATYERRGAIAVGCSRARDVSSLFPGPCPMLPVVHASVAKNNGPCRVCNVYDRPGNQQSEEVDHRDEGRACTYLALRDLDCFFAFKREMSARPPHRGVHAPVQQQHFTGEMSSPSTFTCSAFCIAMRPPRPSCVCRYRVVLVLLAMAVPVEPSAYSGLSEVRPALRGGCFSSGWSASQNDAIERVPVLPEYHHRS